VLKEFKEFIMRGNVMDMAVGIIIGAAFSAIVNSLVKDIITPIIGLIFKADFTNLFWTMRDGATAPLDGDAYQTLAEAQAAGAVTMNYGNFINYVITFLIVAFVIFLLIRMVNRMRRVKEAAPTTKDCSFCLTAIPIKATRCPNCTSDLKTA
jgi:large conductance mechanosensitive channel